MSCVEEVDKMKCPKCGSENCGCLYRRIDSPFKCWDCGHGWPNPLNKLHRKGD